MRHYVEGLAIVSGWMLMAVSIYLFASGTLPFEKDEIQTIKYTISEERV